MEPADTDDLDALVDLWVDLAAGQRAHGSHLLADENRGVVRDTLARHVFTDGLLVARDGGDDAAGEIVGFVMFGPDSGDYDQDVRRGYVHNLYVAPEHRDEGVGGALLTAAEDQFREEGADAVALEVMAANDDARRFYRRHGYDPHRVELEKDLGENDTHTRE